MAIEEIPLWACDSFRDYLQKNHGYDFDVDAYIKWLNEKDEAYHDFKHYYLEIRLTNKYIKLANRKIERLKDKHNRFTKNVVFSEILPIKEEYVGDTLYVAEVNDWNAQAVIRNEKIQEDVDKENRTFEKEMSKVLNKIKQGEEYIKQCEIDGLVASVLFTELHIDIPPCGEVKKYVFGDTEYKNLLESYKKLVKHYENEVKNTKDYDMLYGLKCKLNKYTKKMFMVKQKVDSLTVTTIDDESFAKCFGA